MKEVNGIPTAVHEKMVNNVTVTVPYYSVKDTKAGQFRDAYAAAHTATAIRAFQQQCNNDKNEYGAYPSEFELYFVGHFDQTHGRFIALENPEFVVGGSSLVDWAKRAAKSQEMAHGA